MGDVWFCGRCLAILRVFISESRQLVVEAVVDGTGGDVAGRADKGGGGGR